LGGNGTNTQADEGARCADGEGARSGITWNDGPGHV